MGKPPSNGKSEELTAELQATIEEGLRRIPETELPSVYAISLFVYDDEDDPRRPTLTVGYNTSSHWQASIAQASTPEEARWNYAFWPQNEVSKVGVISRTV